MSQLVVARCFLLVLQPGLVAWAASIGYNPIWWGRHSTASHSNSSHIHPDSTPWSGLPTLVGDLGPKREKIIKPRCSPILPPSSLPPAPPSCRPLFSWHFLSFPFQDFFFSNPLFPFSVSAAGGPSYFARPFSLHHHLKQALPSRPVLELASCTRCAHALSPRRSLLFPLAWTHHPHTHEASIHKSTTDGILPTSNQGPHLPHPISIQAQQHPPPLPTQPWKDRP